MWTQATKVGVHAKSKGHVDGHMQLKEKVMQLNIDATKRRGHATKSGHADDQGRTPYKISSFFYTHALSILFSFPS